MLGSRRCTWRFLYCTNDATVRDLFSLLVFRSLSRLHLNDQSIEGPRQRQSLLRRWVDSSVLRAASLSILSDSVRSLVGLCANSYLYCHTSLEGL